MQNIKTIRKLIAMLFFVLSGIFFCQNKVPFAIYTTLNNTQARIDIFNTGGEKNDLLVNSNSKDIKIDYPQWAQNPYWLKEKGNGASLSFPLNKIIEFDVKIKGKGKLLLLLRSPDKHSDNKRIPVIVTYKDLQINNETVITNKMVSYEKNIKYYINVKDGETLHIKVQSSRPIIFSYLLSNFLDINWITIVIFIILGISIYKGINSNQIFLISILSLLFIPMMSINQAEKSTVENRMLAKFPQFYQNGNINRNVGKEIEKWFNDRFNGREAIITYYEKLRYALSNIYEHKGLYYNKNNQWGFAKDFLRLRHMNKDEHLLFIDNIKKLKKFADKHNIDLYINIVPVATCIYPETRYPFTTDCSNIDIIRQDMATNGLSDLLILPYEELKGQKDLVMHKLEEHWSEYGAFIGYQAVMNKIKEKHPQLKILTEDDFIITYSNQTRTDFGYRPTNGGIYHQLKLPKSVLTAQYKNYEPKNISIKILNNTSATTITQTKGQNPFKVYIIGNSYAENLFYFMRYSFNDVIKKRKNPPEFNSWNFSRWKEDIIKNKPDILIISAMIEQGNPIDGMFKENK